MIVEIYHIIKIYYLYCDSGSKSRKLCMKLNGEGYHTVDLVGGYLRYKGLD